MSEHPVPNFDHAILDAGAALAKPTHIDDGGAFVTLPMGYHVESIEKFLPAPSRARGMVYCETPDAFVRYYNRFCDDEASLVFACTDQFQVQGVLDWHRPPGGENENVSWQELPGFGEHRVTYNAPRSNEWATWTGANGEKMGQTDFSRFIEDNVKDIREPSGADVLEVARELEVKKKVHFNGISS